MNADVENISIHNVTGQLLRFLEPTTTFLLAPALGANNVTSRNDNAIEKFDDVESQYTPYGDRPETYIIPVVFFIIYVVGVLGNGTLVIVFLRHPNMRNIPNTYIFSLALADLLVIVTCVPFIATVYTLESWPWGEVVCKLSESVKDVSIGVSVFTLTALSAERYCAIVNPLRKLQTKPLTVISAIFIWVLATLCALPAAIISNVQEFSIDVNKSIHVCTPFPPDNEDGTNPYTKYNVVAKALIYYFLPLCVIACFYILMAHRLHASARDMPGERSACAPQSRAQARARRHVARMVLVFVVIFIACFLPYHVFMLWFHLHPTSKDDFDDYWHVLRIVGFCLSFFNSCVNPIALYCVSGVFRQYFNRYLCCIDSRRIQRGGNLVQSTVNCETSFNSTYRRHTQDTTIGGLNKSASVMYHHHRKPILARQNTQDTTIMTLETHGYNNKKDMLSDVDVMRKSMIGRNDKVIRTDQMSIGRSDMNNGRSDGSIGRNEIVMSRNDGMISRSPARMDSDTDVDKDNEMNVYVS